MAKRKYTKSGETPKGYECTNRKCKWAGTDDEKAMKPIENGFLEHVCPQCKNNEFYGLLENPNICLQKCESCENDFDISKMAQDAGDNYLCHDCWDELWPIMAQQHSEMKAKGEID
ncbi:hypothetical protein JJC03_15620 [Flavobacterium oreochromis]|uniref:hypothetical protein n=1 Tax=Flavobacterium oreochromis TaxID=2906078 RepID=UPI001CE64F99|nr:hypothetical protein [Flavobacterium oreochromis]QYS86328.1 hypothetical protein JJC03_15620 [Flavobacterium oreochromis]